MKRVFELETQLQELQGQHKLKIKEDQEVIFVAAKSMISMFEVEASEEVSCLEHEHTLTLQERDTKMLRINI